MVEQHTEVSAADDRVALAPEIDEFLTELEDTLDEFFTEHPDPAEIDTLLWRMFFHASLYDQEKNGAAAYFEDYGPMRRTRSFASTRFSPSALPRIITPPTRSRL